MCQNGWRRHYLLHPFRLEGMVMVQKLTVLDFLKAVSAHGMPYEPETNIREIVICRNNIVICIQPKDYISKL